MKKPLLVLALFLSVVFMLSHIMRHDGVQMVGNVTSSVMFLGDTYFGESYKPYDLLEEGGYFSRLETFRGLLNDADEVVLNLETTLVEEYEYPLTQGKSYRHYADATSTLEALSQAGVTAVSVANNHAVDYGAVGLLQGLSKLDRFNIESFGGGEDSESALMPYIMTLPNGVTIAVYGMFEERESYRTKYEFYATEDTPGVAVFDMEAFAESVTALRATDPKILVVAFPHWGTNYATTTNRQRQAARDLVNAGADLIIGHGAHQLQEVWQENGVWVVSGIGNFAFLSPGRYEAKQAPPYSAIVQLRFENEEINFRLYPIYIDNKKTDFRPRFADSTEFVEAVKGIPGRQGVDQYGYYLEIQL